MQFYLANVALYNRGVQAAQDTARAWDEQWQDALGISQGGSGISGGILYGAISEVGVLIAVGALLFMVVKIIKEWNDGNYSGWDELIWPLIVATVLANPQMLAEFTFDLRNTINQVNSQVLQINALGLELQDAFRQAQGLGNVQASISGLVRQCETTIGQAQIECLNEAFNQSEQLLQNYQGVFGDAGWIAQRLSDLGELRDAIAQNPLSLLAPVGLGNPVFWSVVSPSWEAVVYGILWGWQSAFQNGVEVSLLLTGLVGPLALAGSILPFGGAKPIFGWLTGFFSVGLLKLSYNIIAGLAASNLVNSGVTDSISFPLFIAIIAPALSSAIAFGGGLAVWQAATGAIRSGAEAIAKIAL